MPIFVLNEKVFVKNNDTDKPKIGIIVECRHHADGPSIYIVEIRDSNAVYRSAHTAKILKKYNKEGIQ